MINSTKLATARSFGANSRQLDTAKIKQQQSKNEILNLMNG